MVTILQERQYICAALAECQHLFLHAASSPNMYSKQPKRLMINGHTSLVARYLVLSFRGLSSLSMHLECRRAVKR
jgi:hypothetical protein